MSQALEVGCPTCGAPAGEKCRYVGKNETRKVMIRTSDDKLLRAHPKRWAVRHLLDKPVLAVPVVGVKLISQPLRSKTWRR